MCTFIENREKHNFRKQTHLLIYTMTSRGDPVVVDDGPAAPVCAGEAKEGRPPDRNLPGPPAKRGVLAAHDARFRSAHRLHTALCESKSKKKMRGENDEWIILVLLYNM